MQTDKVVPSLTSGLLPDDGSLRTSILYHVNYSLGLSAEGLQPCEAFRAVALAIRDRMVRQSLSTDAEYRRTNAKRLYYLSLEFLIGRSLRNNLVNLGLLESCSDILHELGVDFADVEEYETDAALGNGGLGRLAACFLDSLATLGMPGFGYGINYEYGLFRQEIRDSQQVEMPDNWRTYDTPWQIQRPQDAVLVSLYGHVEHTMDRHGRYNPMWLDWKVVIGVPCDMPVVGYGGKTVNYLRLYSARASQEFDMHIFNEGDYLNAVQQKVQLETISKVLYPSDSIEAGKELRLVQEYFLVACAVRDIVRTYQRNHVGFDEFPDQVAIQLNDTHPALTIAELMRIFVDEQELSWERAWEITTATCAYTNHTLMAEALERWPVSLLERVLPRHLQIIYEINDRLLAAVAIRWPDDHARRSRMSLIEEGPQKQVRMAHLAIAGSHSVNGVAAVHSRLVTTELVPDFYAMWPERFNNKTNGVTPRLWLLTANPNLAALITESISDGWITDLDQLQKLKPLASDRNFQERFRAVKQSNKKRLVKWIRRTMGESLDAESLFDVHVKRIHEYKRQLLNVLHIVYEYLRLTEDGIVPVQPRTWLFSGKAAPGYYLAKQIIRLIHDVARVINHDSRCKGHLKVCFLPDYRVSLAHIIIPAADISEQISTAGMEASGTSNMKFAMNGALTIGTLDGANIEIREEVGAENFFLFGHTVEEIRNLQSSGYRPSEIYQRNASVRRVIDALRGHRFTAGSDVQYSWICDRLLTDGEPYFHLADFESYLKAHDKAGALYGDHRQWTEKAILNTAAIGKFSSDRTIREYARDIWNIHTMEPVN
ncbi:MAG: glycogen/starch/alpha-glucan phosphorylase [Planctomycetaceae bacterium]